MSKGTDAKAGLLGKVTKLIRSPAPDRADVEQSGLSDSPSAFDVPQSHLALKEMLKHKRRNDLVRKHEFDMLRKIRHKSRRQGDGLNTMELSSSYSSTQLARDAEKQGGEPKRTRTLRQIDEIEAQLSRGWFRNKPGDPTTAPMKFYTAPQSQSAPATPPAGAGTRAKPAPIPDQPAPPMLTQAYQHKTAANGMASAPAFPPRPAAVHDTALEHNIEVDAFRQDPEIEEAAINFANGNAAAAQLTLLNLVSPDGSRRKDVQVWLALFDLYRVTGKSEAFDGLVPEFTTLFARSAPQWERTQDKAIPDRKDAAPQAAMHRGAFAWSSPMRFDARELRALTGVAARSAPPWRFDWRAIKTMEPDVLPPLNELLTQWADTPVQLQFAGADQLLAVLAERSPAQDKSVNQTWWHVRLTLLRLMGGPDLFDQAALDYCITYEISPPAWTPPKCDYTPLAADGQPESTPADGAASELFVLTTITDELLTATGVFETALEGEIVGSADRVLAVLPRSQERIHAFDFDCRALRRVDFGAAGELLNWAIEQQNQGRTVTFRGVHRLLAAFFSVIGVNAITQVVLRKD
jgi:ABC-type transporter Mla MlaB component